MTTRIDTEADLAVGMAHLSAVCPTMRAIIAETGAPPLRRRAGGFAGLVSIVIAQQVSVASARAIEARFAAAFPGFDPALIAVASEEALRAAGLSRPKMRTLTAAARAATDGTIDFEHLGEADTAAVHAHLTPLPGIGPWTADIYALFCLGHGDAFAPGDLALQEALRIAHGLEERPAPDVASALARHWSPWRGVAARLLWAYYALAKKREGVTGA